MKAKIGHIILNVRNFTESVRFYNVLMEALGFKTDHLDSGDWGKMKSYRQGEHNLWIRFDALKKSESFVRNPGLDHLAFEVKSRSQVDELFKVVKKCDVKITRMPRLYPDYTKTYYAFYFRDPNGIPLEIYRQ